MPATTCDHPPPRPEAPALARAKRWVLDLYACMERTRTFGLAAETAFWLFLSLLPLAAVAGLVAARLSMENWHAFAPLLASLPPSARELIIGELVEVSAWNDGSVGLGAALTFLWLASSGIHALFDALEVQSGASRPWWRKRLYAVATCLALSLGVGVLAVLGPGLEGALRWLGGIWPALARIGAPTTAGRVVRFLMGTLIVFGHVCALYLVGVPPAARRRMRLLPGAALAVGLELLFGFGYAAYVSNLGDGSAYTAGLSVIGITLTGLYLLVIALLVGALVNHSLGPASPA